MTGLLPRGKPPASAAEPRPHRDANAILRERLVKIVKSGEKKE